jgi:hypothetical protein
VEIRANPRHYFIPSILSYCDILVIGIFECCSIADEIESMKTPRSKRSRKKTLQIGGVMVADAGQWRQWLSLSPAERLEAASRLWLQSREIHKHTKRSLRLAARKHSARV